MLHSLLFVSFVSNWYKEYTHFLVLETKFVYFERSVSWIEALILKGALKGWGGGVKFSSLEWRYPRLTSAVILAWFCPCFLGWFWPILYFLCETSTWHLDSCPPRGHVVWRDSVGVKSARIFFIRTFSGCCAILTSPKKGETAVYGYNPALFWVLSVSCWCLAELIFT